MKILSEKLVKEDHEYGYYSEVQYTIAMTSDFELIDTNDAIKGRFNYKCNHDFDCCGCIVSRVDGIKKLHGNTYLVDVTNIRNV